MVKVVKVANKKIVKVGSKVWIWLKSGLADKIVGSINAHHQISCYYSGEFGDKVKRVVMSPVSVWDVYATKADAIALNPEKARMTECATRRNGKDQGVALQKRRSRYRIRLKVAA